MKYFKVLKLSSLIHFKPSNLNKSNLKPSDLSLHSKYMKQCISLFICAHLIATPCAYALESASHSALEIVQLTQSIPTPPHTTQPNLLHSTTLVEQIPTPQLPTSQIIPPQPTAPHSITPPPSTPQVATPPFAPQPDTPQSLQSITAPLEAMQHSASITSQIDLVQSPQVQQPLLASQSLAPPPISPPNTQDSLLDSSLDSLPKPSTPSLDSSLPSQLDSLDSLPITPDTSTPSLSPSITHSPNNIEIINITTPNAQGISNNHYIDFNIKPKGAILNNSLQSITSTHLAGFISSNPHLKDSTASLILNQVTSANPSYLLGMLEVAGDKASVLIANPNGIVCKSCGFSNVANLALSTALIEDKLALNEKWLNNTTNTLTNTPANTINPTHTTNHTNTTSNANTTNALSNANSTQSQQSHQSLQEQLKRNLSLRVQKGHINIDSLNASNTTTLTLLSKSLKINKTLYANNLSILLGSNDISLSDKGALLLWQPLQIANTPNAKNTINDKTSTSPQTSTQSNATQTSLQRNQHLSTQSSTQANAGLQSSAKSTQQSTQEIAPQSNSANEVLALDIAYLGGVFANSIYLIASDEHSLVQNSGTMATLPSNTQGDNGFYIDINGRLSIATKPNEINQATQTTKENQANQSTNQTKQISKALYSHNATQSHISNDSNQSNPNTIANSITHTDNTNATNHTASIAPTIYATLHSTQDNKNTTNTQSTTNTANIANTPNTPNTTSHNATDTTNTADTTHTTSSTPASLYASSTLNIFAKSITNTHSTIYAGNALSMRVDTLENTQGSIYALNALSIYANTINNIGLASTKTELQSKQYLTQGNLKQVGDKHFWRSVYVDRLDSFSPSIIASSGDTYILAHTLSNHNSYISASNILEIQAKNSSNTQTQAYQKVIDNGVEVRNYQYTYWKNYAGARGIVCAAFTFGICNIRELRIATAQGVFTYAPPHSISKIELDFPTLDSQLEPNIARVNAGIANEYVKYIHSARLSPATNQLLNTINSVSNTNTTSYPNTTNTPSSANATNDINELASYSNDSLSTSAFDSGRYDDRESFARSSYFYQQFASRDSSQAKIFLANLDLESKAIFYNSSAFLSNALDTKILSNSQANHLKSLLLHQHYHNNSYNNLHNNPAYYLKSSNSTSPALSPFASSIGFSGDFISLHSRTFSNDSTLQANEISLHTREALAHLGEIKAKDIVLQSDGTLYIGGGDIHASSKAYLQAKHISIDSLITTTNGYTSTTQTILAPARYAISTNASSSLYPFALSSSVNHTSANYYPNQASYLNQTNHTNQLGASLTPLHSIDSITATSTLKAGSLFLHATDSTSISSANLSADDSISISSSTLRLNTQALHSAYKDSYQTRKSTTSVGTTLSANSISLSAKDSLNLANASLKANESISLHSKGNISLDSTTDTHYATSTRHSTKEHFFYSKDTTTTTTTQSEVQRGSSLRASTISLNAQDSILSNGTNYHASNALSLNATNNYIESALSRSTSKDTTTSTSDSVLGFIPINTKDTHIFAKDTTHTNSTLKASSISISAKNTTLLGVDIRSQDEASISTDSFSLANVQDSHYLSTSSKSKRVFGLKNSEQKDTLSKSLAHKSNLTSKNLTLHSNNDINIIASDITISNDALLSSKGNINIHNAYSTTTTTHYEKQTDFSQAITQGLKAALTGGISLLKDTKCNGGKCSLHTTIADYKEGTSSTYAKEVISSNLNIGNNLVISNASSSNNALANGNTPIGNSEIASNSSSAPNISILGSNLQANNISLDSANDIVIASAKNSYSTSQSHTQGNISTTLSVGNAYVDAGYAGYGVYQASTALAKASKDYEHIKSLHKQGKASSAALEDAKLNVALATANLTTSMINLTNATASAATAATTGYGTGMYVSAGLSLAGSKQSTDSASTIHTASFLSSNNDISLNAANSITQKGSHLLADNSISYKANNDITLQSSEDTHSSKHSYKDFSTSIEYGTNGFGMQANYSQENSKANSISQNNSTSYAKHITLNTDKSLNIISSNVESNTLEVNAGSLKIESKYSTQYAKGNGVSTSLGYGSTTSNASSHTPQSPLNRFAKNAKSLNLSLGISSSNTDKEWIQTQASLLSQGGATINIRGNTHLAGGILSSKQEKLSLNTHSLTHSHLSSKDYNDSKAFSLSLSASDTELNLHNQGHKKEGIAYATLGYGHINHTLNTANAPITLSNNNEAILSSTNIPSNTNPTNATINLADKANTPNTLDTAIIPNTPTPHTSLSGLNRDLSRSTTIIKDTQTNALDSSLSIDNRIFSRNGRERIASDIKNFKKNTLVSGYGATNTLYNAISTPFQALSNKDISLKDTPTLWKLKQSQQSTALTRSQDDFAKDTLDNLSQGKDTLDIQYALALGISSTEKPSKIYYNPNDEALGFHSTSQATYNQNYLNAASGIITDTNATIFTDAHERAHTYTHSEALANIAGKEAIKAWNIANLIHTSINTNRANTNSSKNLGLSSTNISSNTAYKDISKGASNITPISQATSQNALDDNNFGDLDLVEHLTPKFYLTPKSWLATQSKESKSALQSNTYNASLIDSVDRDNALPLVPIITFGMTAYRWYNFAQRLDKTRDIIARANPIQKGDKLNLDDFTDNVKNGDYEGQNKHYKKDPKTGLLIQKDTAKHGAAHHPNGGKEWKVFDKNGKLIGALDKYGNVIQVK